LSDVSKTIISSCRLVQIDNASEQWSSALVRQLFDKMIALKIAGYRSKYPSGVIPFDTSCWFATHFLVCQVREGLHPIMSLQRTTLEHYRRHYLPFGPLSSCMQGGCVRHIDAMQKLVADFSRRPDKLSYTGGFTINPELRHDRELVVGLSRLMVVLHYFLHRDAGAGHEVISAPTVRFKVDSLLSGYGFFPMLEPDERDDGLLAMQSYAGEKVRFMRVQAFNQKATHSAAQYDAWWNERLLLQRQGDTLSETIPT
jgi:hypothetical protein